MSERSSAELGSAELEREAQAAREQVAQTAQSIRKKLTAGQLVDEFSGMVTGGDLLGAVRNLGSQIRRNPLPLALVGAGLAWFAFGKGVPEGTSASADRRYVPPSAEGGGMKEAAGRATEELSHTADRLKHSMLTGVSEGAHSLAHGAKSLKQSASDMAEREPIWVAVIGAALGAAVGTLLPASELEKREIGPEAERFKKEARGALHEGVDSAGRVVKRTHEALREEADRQGLAPGGGTTLGERAGEVVRSAAHSAEATVREELGGNGKEGPTRS